MKQPYIGYLSEIRMVAFNYAPRGWAYCDGSLLPIAENADLFKLLGTTFGGDGQSTFALPDLRGRVPLCSGEWSAFGTQGGEAEHQLSDEEVPGQHSHDAFGASIDADTAAASGNALAQALNFYVVQQTFPVDLTTMAPATVRSTGGQPHENRQPYLAVSFCICTVGDPPPAQ
jgi:microcystin-dependent protein